MNETPKISGFTIVRNATILAYPFRESVLSILPLCEEFIINCGNSTDDTAQIVELSPIVFLIENLPGGSPDSNR